MIKTCDNCAREFTAKSRRHHCSHCDMYFYICGTCAEKDKVPCRKCGVPLKKKREPRKVRV